ncbi:hypothetical protein K504DRAFT_470126 [Pleomassaria siparia CBS 279.74]|uniref:Uncharacterized protein n=1 Tax=Pleomassaria siparia CBS 279.74 TaxID=1314801 RepID=A0A6G1K5Q4_9PLEO|nr:hypothetical protein K504DRAFT_470126 [Pleomassaria siparia CBS 279.74]
MSLARAVTKRMKRSDAPAKTTTPSRNKSVNVATLQIDRAKISSPVVLLSTTNMLSYDAPDISSLGLPSSSSISSTHSVDDSDQDTVRSRSSSHGSRDTLTDASSVSSSPTSPAPNHLSEYFAAGAKVPRKYASSSSLQQRASGIVSPIPEIPERALSHSKRAHERLAQKRSLQNMKPSSVRSSREHRASIDFFRSTIKEEESQPFGKELEQLNEVAEEFVSVVRNAEMDADMAAIHEHGLAMFGAADYLQEIRPLYSNRFGYSRVPGSMAWI